MTYRHLRLVPGTPGQIASDDTDSQRENGLDDNLEHDLDHETVEANNALVALTDAIAGPEGDHDPDVRARAVQQARAIMGKPPAHE